MSTFVKSAMVAGVSGSVVIPNQVLSAPKGGVISHGSGSINTNDKVTTVQQSSSSMVVDWQSFNVAQDELVKFEQPSTKAATLNRIHDQQASQILGRVEGQGKVFLINPNGIVFGENSSVNIGSLVASTKQISDHDFMSGNIVLQDSGDEGVIINKGTLMAATGGAVVLVGDTVVNEGVIQATKGRVILASAESATLDFDGDGLLKFKLTGETTGAESDTAVLNTGLISAADGSVLLTAKAARDVFANVVNNTGVIEAKGIDTSGGKIRLIGEGGAVRNSGQLIASSATGAGGDIDVTGDRTIVEAGALLDVSGETGGGNIRVGGGYQGKDTDINNSGETLVEESAELKADAGAGDGGRVIVWADETTSYKGSISARGGESQGDGGFAEVSGKETLQFSGDVDLSAPSGKTGELLIDPKNIRIAKSGSPISGNIDASDPPTDARIDVDDLIELLKTTNISLQATDNIFVEAGIDTSVNTGGVVATTNLTLDAGKDISINDEIRLVNGETLSLTAGGLISQSHSVTASSVNIDADTVTLTQANDFDTLSLNGATAQINDVDGVEFGSTDLTGNLTVTAAGNITQSGVVEVAGATSLTATNADITLDNSGNDFSSLALNGINATIEDSNALTLAASTLTGNLDVTSGGDLTQSGAIDVDGATSLTATNANITLFNASNDFSSLSASANNLSIRDVNALSMGALNVNNLTVTIGGDLTQSGAFVATNTANIDANSAILTQANNFKTLSLNGGSAEVNDVNSIELGASDLTGTLTVTAAGNITQSGAVEVAGATSLTATGSNITLDDSGNNFSSLALSGVNATIKDSNALTLAASTLTGTLDVTSGGNLIQSGAVDVDGATSLTATNADITLVNAGNDFSSLSASANNLSVSDANALRIAALNVNDLSVTTGGELTQTGAFVVTNTANVDASSAILTQANNFKTLSLNGGSAEVNDVNSIELGASDLTGTLTVTAVGNITQSGAVEVAGATSLTATGSNITLDDSGNNFSSLALSGVNATIKDSNALTLAASTLTGTLDVTSGGNLIQSGAVDVDGATSLTATNADITLVNAGNDFSSLSASANNLSVSDANALRIAALNVNDLSVTTGGELTQTGAFVVTNTANVDASSAILTQANNFKTLSLNGGSAEVNDVNSIELGASDLTGTLTVTAVGNITQSGAVEVAGATSLTATGSNITLDDSGNNFSSLALSGVNATIKDSNALTLAASTLTGTLDVTSGGNLIQSGAVDVDGATSLTATNADITLVNAGNDFSSLSASANNLSVSDANALRIAALNVNDLSVTTGGELTQTGAFVVTNTANVDASSAILTQANNFKTLSLNGGSAEVNDVNSIELGASDLTGTLTVTAVGNITQSGAVEVAGATSLTATGSNITLDDSGNNFSSLALSGVNATIKDSNALTLAASTLTGTLDVTSGGNLIQSGAVDVDGATSLTATNADITLVNAGNDFSSLSASANNLSVSDANALRIAALNVNDLTVTAGGALTQTGAFVVTNNTSLNGTATLNHASNDFNKLTVSGNKNISLTDMNEIVIAESSLSGDLTITAGGNITQSGAIDLDGVSILTASGDITLENAGNDFNSLSASANNLSVRDANALSIAALNVNDLSVTTGGELTQTGAFVVTNNTSLNGTATLNHASNDFNKLTVSGNKNISLTDMNEIEIAKSSLSGGLTIVAGGHITQSDAIEVGGATSLTATGGDITLLNVGNDFSSLSASANNLSVRDANALSIAALNVNDLTVTTGGALTQTGAFVVTNDASINGTATLNHANNDFNTLTVSGNKNITLTDVNEIVIAESGLSGNLTIAAGGNITQSGAIDVDGVSILSTSGDITLENSGNDFNSLSASAANLSVHDVNALSMGAVTVDHLSVTAGGALTQTDAFVVANTANINASSATLTQANNFNTLTLNGGSAEINDVNAIELGSTGLTGSLEITTAGNITQSGAIEVGGATSLTATNADITLDNSGNNFSSLALNGVNATIEDSNALALAASTLTGTLDITSGGGLTQSGVGAIDVDGTTTLTASGDITLENASNDFNSITASANNLSVRDTDSLNIAALNVNDLAVTAGGELTQTGAFVVTNTASIDANVATLTQANDFNTLSLSGASALVNDVNAIELGNTDLTGSLTLTAAGNITQSGAVKVDFETNLTATNADITLVNAANDFIRLSASANNLSVRDANALSIGALSVNDLSVTTGGALTQTGAFVVANTASIDASSATLTQANNFNTLSLNGGTAQINDVDGVVLGSSDLTGNLTVTAAGNITQSGAIKAGGATSLTATGADITLDNNGNNFFSLALDAVNATIEDSNALTLAASALTGNLDVTSGGNLTQSGAIDVDGATSLTATSGDITLNNSGNDFNSLSASANNLSARDVNALSMGTINVNDLSVTAGGALSQTGAIVVANTASIDADTVTLTQANNFNTLELKADSAQINDVDSIVLGESDLTTSLSVTAAGDISQIGALSVPSLSIDAGAGNVTLEHTGNQFDNLSIAGNHVSIRDQDALELRDVNAANFKVVVDSAISQQVGTVLTVTDELSLSASNITLGNANQIHAVELLGGGSVILKNTADLELNDIDVTDLTLDVTGSISNTTASNINVANAFTVTNTGNIDLGRISGDQVNFGSVVLNSGNVILHEDSSTLLQSSTASSLTVNSAGNVTDDGDLSVSGLLTVDASGDIELGTLGASEVTRFGQISLKGANIRLIEEDAILVNRAEGDSVELISETGGIKTNGTQIVAQSLLRLDAGPNQDIGDPGNLVNFTLDTSGSLIIDARSAYLTQSAADISRQVALFSSTALIRSEANLNALTRSEVQFLSYLLGLDDALFNEFVTIFDVADEGMLLPEDQREEELAWFNNDGRYLVSVDRNDRFEYYHDQWAKYGIVFSLQAMNTQQGIMEWM
ncbi:two-partner secretion domain-containing protein [Aliamphritea ceti]|uniref:two-partner secretion domain-containing protein n=1 Tax=Aliamphritea ceti TaxID=1524258 RepID=UPI0021C35421|nr:filamentous hemagglutinin N-terminal domain-containing protein [Aliamphritea ceti]